MSSDEQRDKAADAASEPKEDNVEAVATEGDDAAVDAGVGAAGEGNGDDGLSELDRALAQAEQNHDLYLRAAAELSNFRKRTVKMRSETRDDTLRDVLLQVGPMLDNFRRALAPENDDPAVFRQGIELIFKQFNDILAGYGLVEIDATGKPFDPNQHEAVVQVPSDEHPPGTVMQEMEKGYMLNDRVVRPARVVVSAAKEAASDDSDSGVDAAV